MTSNPPAKCCTIGVLHEGTPTGKLETIAGTEAYIATPTAAHPSVALLLLTDVIGHKFVNAQLIADQFAANGYLTLMPELFHGDPVLLNHGPTFDIQKWLKGAAGGGEGPGHGVERIDPIVQGAAEYLRAESGVKKLGAVGYCYGAKPVIRALGSGLIDVAYVAHPSFVDKAELEKINGPLSISAAETDKIFTSEKRHETEAILKEIGQPYQINLFSNVEHGFAVRGDVSIKAKKFAKEQAFYQAVQWFDEWLKF